MFDALNYNESNFGHQELARQVFCLLIAFIVCLIRLKADLAPDSWRLFGRLPRTFVDTRYKKGDFRHLSYDRIFNTVLEMNVIFKIKEDIMIFIL